MVDVAFICCTFVAKIKCQNSKQNDHCVEYSMSGDLQETKYSMKTV